MKRPELSMPAGSLQCALYAFKGGADSVYLGMKSFSARKSAVNFSFEDLRKLKTICLEQKKKFYVTVNTLVHDDEIPQLLEVLKQLEYAEPDGIIIQDLGIAKIIRENFPNLKMQASTQLAVHTVQGVKELQKLGFQRIVLSRELSLEEISEIRKACPDVEIKVFIHGAQCYGFSGVCMASQVITGRSANRGACAQICRTWFTCRETGNDGWFFSMKDMKIGSHVLDYAKIGIDAFKVEGRMKGPEYVYHTARYYSLLLDGKNQESDEVKAEEQAMETAFARESNFGFFNTEHHGSMASENLTCPTWPTHRGIRVGTIEKVMTNSAKIRFEQPVALRDGLLVIYNKSSSGFALKNIQGSKSFVSAGETATVNFPSSEFSEKPVFGTPVFCTSRHNGNLPLISENIALYKKKTDVHVVLEDNAIVLNSAKYDCQIQEAKTQSNIEENLQSVLRSSDTSLFTLGELCFENKSGFKDPFIPLSVLKKIRRDFYDNLDSEYEKKTKSIPKPEKPTVANLPNDRSILGLWDQIICFNDKKYLPLSPLMFDENAYLDNLDKVISDDPQIIVGLNNIAQVHWAEKHPEVKVFADAFLYTANSFARADLQNRLPSLVGSYELDEKGIGMFVGDNFHIPLFVSRTCLRHNGLGKSCSGCSRDNTYHLIQNGKTYTAHCKNCITTVI